MHANDPEMADEWEEKEKNEMKIKGSQLRQIVAEELGRLLREGALTEAPRHAAAGAALFGAPHAAAALSNWATPTIPHSPGYAVSGGGYMPASWHRDMTRLAAGDTNALTAAGLAGLGLGTAAMEYAGDDGPFQFLDWSRQDVNQPVPGWSPEQYREVRGKTWEPDVQGSGVEDYTLWDMARGDQKALGGLEDLGHFLTGDYFRDDSAPAPVSGLRPAWPAGTHEKSSEELIAQGREKAGLDHIGLDVEAQLAQAREKAGLDESQAYLNHMIKEELGRLLREGGLGLMGHYMGPSLVTAAGDTPEEIAQEIISSGQEVTDRTAGQAAVEAGVLDDDLPDFVDAIMVAAEELESKQDTAMGNSRWQDLGDLKNMEDEI